MCKGKNCRKIVIIYFKLIEIGEERINPQIDIIEVLFI